MAKNLTVILENRPGTLADLGEVLGEAGINIEGLCGSPCEGRGVIQILVEDSDNARQVLKGAGITVQEERQSSHRDRISLVHHQPIALRICLTIRRC